jgi:hypothetical protein
LVAYIPVTVGGFEFVNNTTESGHPGVLEKLLYSYCGIPCDNGITELQYCSGYSSGMNVSGENKSLTKINGDTVLILSAGIAIAVASVAATSGLDLPAAVAYTTYSLGALSVADSLAGSYSHLVNKNDVSSNNGCRYFPSDESRSYVQMNTDNGTFYNNYYDNVYSSEQLLKMQIPYTEFGHIGQLNLTGENVITQCASGSGSSTQGATANLSIPIVPAYTIHGQVNSDGKGLANQQVLINENTGGPYDCYFYVNTNASGQFRFFAAPGASYDVCLADDSSDFFPLNVAYNDYNSSENLVFNVNPVTFSESGLASGQSWSVNLGGETLSSSTSLITFYVPNGTYSYTVSPASGYSISPSSALLSVDSSMTQVITFTGLYSITFSESNLPSGTTWTVYLDGNAHYSSSSTLTLPAGDSSYSYFVPTATYRSSGGAENNYKPYPSSGSVTVNGADQQVSISFSLVSITTGGGGGGGTLCVNSTTEILMANGTYMQAQYLLPYDYVIGYNTSTHEYQKEEVMDTYISHHSKQYTINGILQVSAFEPILTSKGYVKAENLTTHDRIYDVFTGKYVKVNNITVSSGNFTMYDFQIPPDYDFIAWEYVVYDTTIKP